MSREQNSMLYKKMHFIGFVLPLFFSIACLHSRTSPASFASDAGIKIFYGSAIVKIDGRINENLYYASIFDNQIKDEKYYDNPVIAEGTVTKNETKHLTTGEEYRFSVLPTEVVTMNIISSNGNDVIILVYQYGKEKKYTVQGTNTLGLFIAFQNR
jgi:hypothetical protein